MARNRQTTATAPRPPYTKRQKHLINRIRESFKISDATMRALAERFEIHLQKEFPNALIASVGTEPEFTLVLDAGSTALRDPRGIEVMVSRGDEAVHVLVFHEDTSRKWTRAKHIEADVRVAQILTDGGLGDGDLDIDEMPRLIDILVAELPKIA